MPEAISVVLPEGAAMHVTPAPVRTEQEEARREVFEILSESYDTGDAEAAARHNEHQP
jgi:hypothetical protein